MKEKLLVKKIKIPDKKDGMFSARCNNKAALKEIEHVFDKCASEELLSMKTRGLTQNINESLHMKQHMMCNKHKNHSAERVDLVCQINCLLHNNGHKKGCILNYFRPGVTPFFHQLCDKQNKDSGRSASRPVGQARSSSTQRGHWVDPGPAIEEDEYRAGGFAV